MLKLGNIPSAILAIIITCWPLAVIAAITIAIVILVKKKKKEGQK